MAYGFVVDFASNQLTIYEKGNPDNAVTSLKWTVPTNAWTHLAIQVIIAKVNYCHFFGYLIYADYRLRRLSYTLFLILMGIIIDFRFTVRQATAQLPTSVSFLLTAFSNHRRFTCNWQLERKNYLTMKIPYKTQIRQLPVLFQICLALNQTQVIKTN